MCKAIQVIRNEGIAEGEARGEIRGRLLGLYELVCDGLLTLAQASAKAKMSEEQFRSQMEKEGYSIA